MIIIKTEKLQEVANKIALGVDGDRTSPISELLEFELQNKNLTLKTTNKEYFLKIIIENITENEDYFHTTIDADTFLTLVIKTTTPNIQLEKTDEGLLFIGNGRYTFPIILDGSEVKKLPEIKFNENEVNTSLIINGNILKSIYDFNSKELNKEIIAEPILKHYYMDNRGALTFIESACINEFTLEKSIKVLFNERLVQLFKLFNDLNINTILIKKELGLDINGNKIIQNIINFKVNNIELTAILPDDDFIKKYPANAIRNLAEVSYPGSIILSKNELIRALERLSIFDKKVGIGKIDLKKCLKLKFKNTSLDLINLKDGNYETLDYLNKEENKINFISFISSNDLMKHTNINLTDNLIIKFGTGDAIMLMRQNYKQIIPEMNDPINNLEA